MISFIDKKLDQNNFKVWLYSPGGAFLGELIVDRPVLNLELEGLISTFEFSIPENIEQAIITEDGGLTLTELSTIVNPRLNETLDQFQVEVWYGDLTTDNFQKQRFIIIDTPNAFADDLTNFTYRAYSREYENRFVRIIDWPGVLIKELVLTSVFTNPNDFNKQRTITLNRAPKDTRLIRVEMIKDFVVRLSGKIARANEPYAFSFPAPKRDTIKVFKFVDGGTDILLVENTDYEISVDEYTGLLSIQYLTASSSVLSDNDMVYLEYRLEEPLTLNLIRSDSAQLLGEFDFYYDENNNTIKVQIPEIHKVFLPNTVEDYDSVLPADSRILIKTYYEPVSFQSGDEIFENVTKDGLSIQQVMNSILLYGDEDNNDGKWTAFYANALEGELRAGFNFNNTTLLNAINQVLQSFNAIAIPDTINKYFYIYEKETPDSFVLNSNTVSSYRQSTNLSIEYGKYLRGVQQDISTEELVTVIRGLGFDNITAASASPTGYNEWEDYSYYLDGCAITNLAAIESGATTTIELNKVGRWMSKQLTEKLLLWIQARNGIEKQLYEGPLLNGVLSQELEKFGTVLLNPSISFANYSEEKGLIPIQDAIIDLLEAEQRKLVPLKIEEARQKTMLSILEDPTNVPHLINWTGSFLIPGNANPTPYQGIDGYKDYIQAKKAVLDAQIQTIKNSIGTLERDFAFINAMLKGIYQAIEKDQYVTLIRPTGLEAYNFTADDFKELKGFRREGLYDNKFIVKASDLYKEMKKEIESLRQPRIEISADIIGLLQAVEARVEWNNVVLGGLANIIVPRLNIDRQIQIKSITIAPDDFSTAITFSTVKNYIGIGQKFLGRLLSSANYNLTNNLGYNEGIWLQAAQDASTSINKFNFGFAVGELNPIEAPTLIIDDEGLATDGHTINPFDDTPVNANSDVGRMILFGFVKINAGRIDVFNRDQTGAVINRVSIRPEGLIQESARSVVTMNEEGFAIFGKVDGELDKQFFVDESGNIQFAGQLEPIVKEGLFEDFNITPVDIQTDSFVFKYADPMGAPIPTSILLTAKLRADYEVLDWQYDAGTNNWQSLSTSTTTFTVDPNAAIWTNKDAIRFRVIARKINEPAVTDFDIVTISKLFNGNDGEDGEDGRDAFTVNLTNEAHSLPRTAAGTITYTGSGTDIEVYEGITKLDFDNTNQGDGKWNVTAVGTNITPGVASPLGSFPRSARISQHNNMTATPASVLYTITGRRINGETFTITKTQSLSFAQDGESIVGPEGKKAVTGIVYFQLISSTAPSTPSASSYNIGTNLFQNLTANWSLSSPTFVAGSQNRYWFSRFSGVEGTTTNIVSPVSFTTPQQAINFSGLVTFTGAEGVLSAVNSNVTSIEGGLLKTAVIDSNETIPNSNPIVPKMRIDLNNQRINIGQQNLNTGYDTTGIFLGYDGTTPKFSITGSGATPNFLRWTGSALEMRGRITATSGTIGTFDISEGGATVAGTLITPILSLRQVAINNTIIRQTFFQDNNINPDGDLTASFQNGILQVQRFIPGPSPIIYNTQVRNNGLFGPGAGTGGNALALRITAGSNLILSTTNSANYVYARNGSSVISDSFRVAVSTTGPSTKIIKKDIEPINSILVEEFFDKLEINTYMDLMKNKSKIGLIIEDAEDQNIPFQNMIFKREDQMVLYEALPEWLLPYADDESVVQKHIDDEKEYYSFSPKVIDDHSIKGIMLAGIKHSQTRIKNLEERLTELEEQLKN